ncbi:MAG: hypothetical protein WCJ21_01005 [Planctomycetota bacterium]
MAQASEPTVVPVPYVVAVTLNVSASAAAGTKLINTSAVVAALQPPQDRVARRKSLGTELAGKLFRKRPNIVITVSPQEILVRRSFLREPRKNWFVNAYREDEPTNRMAVLPLKMHGLIRTPQPQASGNPHQRRLGDKVLRW